MTKEAQLLVEVAKALRLMALNGIDVVWGSGDHPVTVTSRGSADAMRILELLGHTLSREEILEYKRRR